MWHVETFDSRGAPGEMDALLEQRLLPWFRSRGFTVHAFVTQASLGERQYWLATEMGSFADIDGWAERGGTEGAAIIADPCYAPGRMGQNPALTPVHLCEGRRDR